MPRRLRQAHRPQAVVGEVVGLEGVDTVEVVHTVEVVEVVMRMTMSWVTSNSNTFNSY